MEEMQADCDIVLVAVAGNGALRVAVKELQAGREIVLEDVTTNEEVFRCAAEELQADREFVPAAGAEHGPAFE